LTFHRSRSGRDTETYLSETVFNAIRDAAKTMNSDQILAPGAGPRLAQQVSADLITHGISDDGLQIGSPGPRVIFTAVVDHLNRKFPASARRLAETSLQSDPSQGLYQAAMGMVLEAEGKPAEAEQRYLEALYLDPTAVEPMSRLFVLYQTSRDPEAPGRLSRLLVASLQKKHDSAVHHDWLGQVYMRTGQLDKAEQAFQTAIGLAPKTPEYRINMGSLRAQQDRLQDARTEYEEALKIRPDHPLGLYNLGVTYALQGDLDHAIENLEKAEKAAPPTVALLNSLAQAYEQKGETAKAVAALRRSLQQRPRQPERAETLKRLEATLRARS
jgi:tetratricopeptide (TPR) repeat protein